MSETASITRKRFSNRTPGNTTVKLGSARKAASFPPEKVVFQESSANQGKKHKKTSGGSGGLKGL